MGEQKEKAFHGSGQAYSEGDNDMKERKEDTTNLQDSSVNASGNHAQTDNVSDCRCEGKISSENDCSEGNCSSECSQNSEKQSEVSWEDKYTTLNDSHLRLIAEFDNFRKRTLREKADLIKSGGETVLTNLLPVIDDFERALNTLQTTEESSSAVEGVKLIYDKFISYLSQQGVKAIDAIGQPFDTELFEAIAAIPAPEEGKKGLVIDCVQTGYLLYDKVLRHAKVVVGE